jgi:beta-aspartyl-peptidase (threonine type)
VPAAKRDAHAAGCREALARAADLLARGGSALDAVQAAVEDLENDPRFNAGTGASLNADGELRLDASIMSGERLAFGAVCDVPAFRNPVTLARAVLDDGRHVLYAGQGAADFARAKGFAPADPASMVTAAALARLEIQRRGGSSHWAGGTVGAVAFDARGHVAAATSTGGLVGKARGRVGDSPVPGAGTYADDASGAVSGTGDGEGFLRYGLALRVCSLLERQSAPDASLRRAIADMLARTGAVGGAIVATPAGELAWARTTATMSWAALWDGADALAGVLPRAGHRPAPARVRRGAPKRRAGASRTPPARGPPASAGATRGRPAVSEPPAPARNAAQRPLRPCPDENSLTLCCCPTPLRGRACARAPPRGRCACGLAGPGALSSAASRATRDDDEHPRLRD